MPDSKPPVNQTQIGQAQIPTHARASGYSSATTCGCGCVAPPCAQYNPPIAPCTPPGFPPPPWAGGPTPNTQIYGGSCGCVCCSPPAPNCGACMPTVPPYQGYYPGFPVPCGVQQTFPTPFYPPGQDRGACVPYPYSNQGPYPAHLPQCGAYPPPPPAPPPPAPPPPPRNDSWQNYAYNYLPQNTFIVQQYSPTYEYNIPQSQTYCFAFKISAPVQQVTIAAALTTQFENVFIPGVVTWASAEPAGISITSTLQSQQNIHLPPTGVYWNFWDIALQNQLELPKSNINSWVYADRVYWFNVKNTQNRPNSFYCRLNFVGPGVNVYQ